MSADQPPMRALPPEGPYTNYQQCKCPNPKCGTINCGMVGAQVSCSGCKMVMVVPGHPLQPQTGAVAVPMTQVMGHSDNPPMGVCRHPAERLVRQKRTIKGTGCISGCCAKHKMVHKCTACGKVADPPTVIKTDDPRYAPIRDAVDAERSGKSLTTGQKAALGGIVAGAAGALLLYTAWDRDNVSDYEPVTSAGGGGCASACGGGVG
eukprot:TRINITY_DN44360_c0_g1_i1.p1 TRINITY_DN44360_c0_g1~~TRINITY_DN44360_c0_g1_i1.p1  ORF type:complete len:217 (+),score=28.01 TRINITY_DN44360_c0_g1_i1:31-651(+)